MAKDVELHAVVSRLRFELVYSRATLTGLLFVFGLFSEKITDRVRVLHAHCTDAIKEAYLVSPIYYFQLRCEG